MLNIRINLNGAFQRGGVMDQVFLAAVPPQEINVEPHGISPEEFCCPGTCPEKINHRCDGCPFKDPDIDELM